MNLYYVFLLLFVVFNVYYESSQHIKPPDPIVVTPPNSSCTLGSLAPALPHIEVFESVLPKNWVFKIALPQNEVFKIVLLQKEDILAQIKHFSFFFLVKKVQNIILKLNSVFDSEC